MERMLDIFRQSEALLEGHFILTSGKHSNRYIQCAKVLQYPHYAEILATELAEQVRGYNASVVIGPAMGGVVLAQEVGGQLGVRAIFSEREQGNMTLRRGFVINPGERVLVVEDVITTGGSVKEVVQLVKDAGGIPVAVAVLVNRSGGKGNFGIPLHQLISLEAVAYMPEQCPLCEGGTPAVKPGSRNIGS
ncbi:orotate phosphoribosyltransferase [Metallumcola ferriviriculae]|uniref:Orotate phosphoribosyltransferase n=1 Tax=Metallumcola ferriviriculae TaxID=3039180 RepID=A0AAU0UQE5_9FIRM|nr:orotate phosphoribosyltransferase [Desulfitibacteraceae bacterium MK1]